jgi:hypothetical protein
MNDAFATRIQIFKELWKFGTPQTVLERLHDQLNVRSFIRESKDMEFIARKAEGFAHRTGSGARLQGSREGDDGCTRRKPTAKQGADVLEMRAEADPVVYEMSLISTSKDYIRTESVRVRDFAPRSLAQMLGVDTNDVESLALCDFCNELTNCFARLSYCFMTPRKCRDVESRELKDLKLV